MASNLLALAAVQRTPLRSSTTFAIKVFCAEAVKIPLIRKTSLMLPAPAAEVSSGAEDLRAQPRGFPHELSSKLRPASHAANVARYERVQQPMLSSVAERSSQANR